MEISKIFYAPDRKSWRAWLKKHHKTAKDIWLVYYKKHTGTPSIPYDDAVEEALCFGWIDSTAKRLDDDRYAQRFSPRRPGSALSELNKVRLRKLIRQRKMTKAGLAAVAHAFDHARDDEPLRLAPDIRAALQKDAETWKHYQAFPDRYKRIRTCWIEMARGRPATFKQRLGYFLKMTKRNKRYGMVR